MKVDLFNYTSDFAENKDVARKLRLEHIEPILNRGEGVTLNFDRVTSATQSFIHALISQTIRDKGVDILDELLFENCNEKIQTIVEIVVEYVQDGIFTEDDNI
jgi:hypothetical protein